MFGAILKATNSSFQKGITFCRSIYVKKVMKLLAFIFEQPSYTLQALRERYTDLLLAMGKHLGHNETIESRMPGELQFVPQLNPREPF